MPNDAEMKAAVVKHSPLPWHGPHLCNDDTSCNCGHIFAHGQDHMGCVLTICIADKEGYDGPTLAESKANAEFVLLVVNSYYAKEKALLQLLAAVKIGIEFAEYAQNLTTNTNSHVEACWTSVEDLELEQMKVALAQAFRKC